MAVEQKIYSNGNLSLNGEIDETGNYESDIPQLENLVAHYPLENGSGQNAVEYDYLGKGWGLLYNQYAALTGNLAPGGCRVATDADFTTLATYLGGTGVAGGKMKKTELEYWLSPNTGATNSSGFGAIGAGNIQAATGLFINSMNLEDYWTLTSGVLYYMTSTSDDLIRKTGGLQKAGLSIRCLLTDPSGWTIGDTVTDYDGNVYETVQIGTQVWLATNLRVTHYNDGTPIPLVTTPSTWIGLTTGAYQPIPQVQSTVYGATTTTDRFGFTNKALNFDGVDDYINCGTIPERISSGSMSISGAFYSAHDGALHGLIAKGAGGGAYGWAVVQDSRSLITGYVRFEICGPSGRTFSTYLFFQQNKWNYFCFTFNINTLECKGYLNAELIGTKTFANPGTYEHPNNNNIIIGRYPLSSIWYFGGKADDFRIWKTDLTQSEVEQDYNSFKGKIQFCDDGNIKAPKFVEDDTLTVSQKLCENGLKVKGEFNEL